MTFARRRHLKMFEPLSKIIDSRVFSVRGAALTVRAILSSLCAVFVFLKLIPILYNLALGIHKRRIAIVGNAEGCSDVEEALRDTKWFSNKDQMIRIGPNSIDKVARFSLIIFAWDKNQAKDVLCKKDDKATLVVYAPPPNVINQDDVQEIFKRPNAILVNYRGRLVNDVFVCMMTTRELS